MRAAIVERYGPPEVVRIAEVEKPVPKDDEVLIRVSATTVNSGDSRIRALRVPAGLGLMMRLALGLTKPKRPILGFDCAGVIEAVGKNATGWKVGDAIAASNGFKYGCHAEYCVVSANGGIARIPEGHSPEDAVSVLFGGATALAFLRLGNLKAGESILINGASGAVGTMAIQIARHIGADVTAVCSAGNAELVRSLGADHVIDYAREDFTKGAARYDVIMDNHGNAPFPKIRDLLKPGGRFLMVIFANLWELLRRHKQNLTVKDDKDAVNLEVYGALMDMLGKGIIKPVIDSRFPFEKIVDAYRRVDTGHKRGSVVVTMS